ncbi:MAG: hypothetical protein L0Y72_13515, partial [Gemmataceae bacterium]|nr:hypothetical protein [Gemmataceae bacterium]
MRLDVAAEEKPPVPDDTPSLVEGSTATTHALTADLFTFHERLSSLLPITVASGERAKAQDILAAVRALKTLDHEGRSATANEQEALGRFAGFGPVALSIFPDPVSGRYKDSSWQELGEELKELLTPEEYESTTLYGTAGYSVASDGDLAEKLRDAIRRLPQFTAATVSLARPPPAPAVTPPRLQHIGEGSFFVNADAVICQRSDGQTIPVVYGGRKLWSRGTHTGKRLAALIRLRDLARRVLQSQNEGRPETERKEARRELNWVYDGFVHTYGPINKTTFAETPDGRSVRRMPNLVKFREDPDAMLVMSLENYDETTGKATKAAIMQKDVVGRNPSVTTVTSAEEGLLVSLDQHGAVDLPFISALYGKAEQQVIAELGDLILRDPQVNEWQTADQYLSGDVRSKLAAVLNAGPDYTRNAEALREVQPEDVLPGDIDANLGAPWIPESDVQAFAVNLFRVEPEAIQIGYLKQEAAWSIDADFAAKASVAASSEFGTARANGAWLLDLAINMKTPVIYDTVTVHGKEERVVNQEETLAAREKQKLIRERFRSWIFSDPDRTERLVRLYNDTYNNLRLRQFDGVDRGQKEGHFRGRREGQRELPGELRGAEQGRSL